MELFDLCKSRHDWKIVTSVEDCFLVSLVVIESIGMLNSTAFTAGSLSGAHLKKNERSNIRQL